MNENELDERLREQLSAISLAVRMIADKLSLIIEVVNEIKENE